MIKIANVYIVYDFEAQPKFSLRNFTLKNCLFGATNILKYSDKGNCVYSDYKIAFDGIGEWSFDNVYARDIIIFEVDHLMLIILRIIF